MNIKTLRVGNLSKGLLRNINFRWIQNLSREQWDSFNFLGFIFLGSSVGKDFVNLGNELGINPRVDFRYPNVI